MNRLKWKFRHNNFTKKKLIENFKPSFNLNTLSTEASYELKGFHFITKDLVNKHRAKICEILKFRSLYLSDTNAILQTARSNYSVLLGVHIRRKDFKEFYNGRFFISVRTYLNIIRDFFALLGKSETVGVVLCSDDIETLNEIKSKRSNFIYPKGSVIQDMFILSECDYLITPEATTMSAWAAFYGNKPILRIMENTRLHSLKDFKNLNQLENRFSV